MEFEGIGRCRKHEPDRVYSFKTEGGVDSTWTDRAALDGEGTQLIAYLGFGEGADLDTAKIGVLAGSLIAGVTGFVLLRAFTSPSAP